MSSDERLALCFGVHDHQPIGNFDHVLVEADARGYRPFLDLVHSRPEIRLTVHCTGSLLEFLRERARPTFDRLGEVVARGQVELLTGGFYEPILTILPDEDKLGQIARLSAFLKSEFGVRPRGMWLAERVWEPGLPRVLAEAGVEYVLVDDTHFALAGLDPETLGGYYLTEEQGSVVRVFPISQRLRYLIPFAEVDATVEYLAARRGRVPAVTVVDDGEKFGVWPGTYAHVYEHGWLARLFDRLLGTPWVQLATFADVVDRTPASGRIYLPTASYREMGEWALPAAAGRALAAAKREAAPWIAGLLRGGFWRGFLLKYPEVADTYWKMLRVSHAVREAAERSPDDPRVDAARELLWRAQANDAYWHGVFGGCYLPHLRREIKRSLLEAERRLTEVAGARALAWSRGDLNGDGRDEVTVRTPDLQVTVAAEAGGTLTELGYVPRGLDLADVFTRRAEAYHDELRERQNAGLDVELALASDPFRRASLLDGLFPADGDLDALAPWPAARYALGDARYGVEVRERGGALEIGLSLGAGDTRPFAVDKRVTVEGATVGARYRLRATAPLRPARWGVQWNLALTAGAAPGRYLTVEGHPSLGSVGRAAGRRDVTLVDEWIGVEARLEWSGEAELRWAPVETVSVSEGGFERIYQGLALLLVWPLAPEDRTWEVRTAMTVTTR